MKLKNNIFTLAALCMLALGVSGTASAQNAKGKAVLRFRFAATDSIEYDKDGMYVKCFTDRARERGLTDSLVTVADGYREVVFDEVSDFAAYHHKYISPDQEALDVMGAVVYAGDTVYMDMTGNKTLSRFNVTFRGPKRSVEASRLFNDAAYAYTSSMQYVVWDDQSRMVGYRIEDALLQAQAFDKKYKKSKALKRDATLRRLVDMMKVRARLMVPREHKNIMGYAASTAGVDTTGMRTYYDPVVHDSLFGTLDVNDPMLLPVDLLELKLDFMRPDSVSVYRMTYEQAVDDIARFDKLLTTVPARQVYINGLATILFVKKRPNISIEQYDDLYQRVKAFCPLDDKVLAGYARSVEAMRSLVSLTDCPDVTLLTPDGQSLQLSSLYDKVLYIDFWASWCVPCRREGPLLDKLATKYRDNDNIAFVSISTDYSTADWHKALDEDKPWWPQYILDRDSSQEFCKALNINTIPRFILLSRGGKILQHDAPRPSDEQHITEMIEKVINGN